MTWFETAFEIPLRHLEQMAERISLSYALNMFFFPLPSPPILCQRFLHSFLRPSLAKMDSEHKKENAEQNQCTSEGSEDYS